MKSAEIREKFLKFFQSKGHQIVASSPLVPANDPTLMFTNSGMVQFKDVFLGFDKRPYVRATSVQACLRAGGKHNDLENVGYTARHHTFFEMLGNWSFGDYFKRESIAWGWELLTQVYGLPPEKLLVTVYHEDGEAYDIWANVIGLPPERIVRIGDNKGGKYKSDNFWMMADTGPCGPCTEIFYDHGPGIPGGPPGSPDEDGDRFIEIWNHVFMQFEMREDGSLTRLPAPCVDTGMGLERLAAILQHVHSNYEIDLFQNLIRAAARETSDADLNSPSLKVIADHIRACAFLVADGVIPGNEGRGYVLRRIIRRAIRHGYKLGARAAFFHELVPDLVKEMGDAYPQLRQGQAAIMAVLKAEEERFFATIENGMAILEAELATPRAKKVAVFDGETAFKLHDTYGFPLDLTADVCREHDVTVDTATFEAAMARQKERARAAGKFKMSVNLDYSGAATNFEGYETLEAPGVILALYRDGAPVEELREGEMGIVVLDNTPFYAESGGQLGDRGELRSAGLFAVEDTQKIQAAVFGHHGIVATGALKLGETVTARVDAGARAATARNHSATHLVHKALREVLGTHVQQKGSQVDPDKTRFDFSHAAPMSAEEIREVETLVNAEILQNTATDARVMTLDEAQKTGAMVLFGEKYGDEVRVVKYGTSIELCGGTHIPSTGMIGSLYILNESSIAAGVRRIEAVTAEGAEKFLYLQQDTLRELRALMNNVPNLAQTIQKAVEENAELKKQLTVYMKEKGAFLKKKLLAEAVERNGVKVIVFRGQGNPEMIKDMAFQVKGEQEGKICFVAGIEDKEKCMLAVMLSDELVAGGLDASRLVKEASKHIQGGGGGQPHFATAGGKKAEGLGAAIDAVLDMAGLK